MNTIKPICTIFLALLLPMLAAAQEKPVQVIPCCDGKEFTISILVKFPAGDSVTYKWFRNGVLINGSEGVATTANRKISYRIPESEANGDSVVFHFKYCLSDDGCKEWTSSPKYVLTFAKTNPQIPHIAGDATVCAGAASLTYTVAYETGVRFDWTVPTGWTITRGHGTNSITVALSPSAVNGYVSVLPFNNCQPGVSDTLSVSIVTTTPGAILVDDYICVGGITTAGAVDVDDYSCAIATTPGAVVIDDYACVGGVSTAGAISVDYY